MKLHKHLPARSRFRHLSERAQKQWTGTFSSCTCASSDVFDSVLRGAVRLPIRLLCVTLAFATISVVRAQTPSGAAPGAARAGVVTAPPSSLDDIDQLNRASAGEPEAGAGFAVPPIAEREADVESALQIEVSQLQLVGVTKELFPKLEIEPLVALVEKARAQFFLDDLSDPLPAESQETSEQLAFMSIGELEAVADELTRAIRAQGYFLARAYLPAQEVIEGVVKIAVLRGVLGDVKVEAQKNYAAEIISAPFADLVGEPVWLEDAERALLRARAYPGLEVSGVFQPGVDLGETSLVLRVTRERTLDGSIRFDNHGTRFTGRNRLLLDVQLNNPTRSGDALELQLLRQLEPDHSRFGRIGYRRPLSAATDVGFSLEHNPFEIGAEIRDLGITGDSAVVDVNLEHTFARSRTLTMLGRLSWQRARSRQRQNGLQVNEDNVSKLGATFSLESVDLQWRGVDILSVGLELGLGDFLGGDSEDSARRKLATREAPFRTSGETGAPAASEFAVVRGAYARVQRISASHTLIGRLEGQYSRDLLPSIVQFSLGGPRNVRAFAPAEALVDSAFFASMEWRASASALFDLEPDGEESDLERTLIEGLAASVFVDYGFGTVNEAPVGDSDGVVHLAGFGAGLEFSLPQKASARLQWSRPFGERRSGPRDDPQQNQWWLEMQLDFDL